ncbi:1055_t:CDS:2, partial [Entrophospora sp. SA101]
HKKIEAVRVKQQLNAIKNSSDQVDVFQKHSDENPAYDKRLIFGIINWHVINNFPYWLRQLVHNQISTSMPSYDDDSVEKMNTEKPIESLQKQKLF